MDTNQHGLSRHIPSKVKREIRQRSKFGCVLCRSGIYHFEHIIPEFKDSKEHDPDKMCCLCGTCHDLVSRGQFSKIFVSKKYFEVQKMKMEELDPPTGPLDFHEGNAKLLIGGIKYDPGVMTVVRYHGKDLIKLQPGKDGEPGKISGILTNSNGEVAIRLSENEWVGSLQNWDIEIKANKLIVRSNEGTTPMILRLDPPGSVIVEKLDMSYEDVHILATESTYVVGRYTNKEKIHWLHAMIDFRSRKEGCAIEFANPEELKERCDKYGGRGKSMNAINNNLLIDGNLGVMFKPTGIVIGSYCNGLNLGPVAMGTRDLDETRKIIFNNPDKLPEFIGTGKVK